MVKTSPANVGNMGSIPGSGRSPGEGNGNPFQYSCLGNLMDSGTWQATVHGIAESETTEQLSNNNLTSPSHFWLHSILQLVGKQKVKVKSESEVAQSCPTLFDPMDCSLPGSSLHGILQARVLEWGAISFARGSSRPRDRTRVSLIPGRCLNL